MISISPVQEHSKIFAFDIGSISFKYNFKLLYCTKHNDIHVYFWNHFLMEFWVVSDSNAWLGTYKIMQVYCEQWMKKFKDAVTVELADFCNNIFFYELYKIFQIFESHKVLQCIYIYIYPSSFIVCNHLRSFMKLYIFL